MRPLASPWRISYPRFSASIASSAWPTTRCSFARTAPRCPLTTAALPCATRPANSPASSSSSATSPWTAGPAPPCWPTRNLPSPAASPPPSPMRFTTRSTRSATSSISCSTNPSRKKPNISSKSPRPNSPASLRSAAPCSASIANPGRPSRSISATCSTTSSCSWRAASTPSASTSPPNSPRRRSPSTDTPPNSVRPSPTSSPTPPKPRARAATSPSASSRSNPIHPLPHGGPPGPSLKSPTTGSESPRRSRNASSSLSLPPREKVEPASAFGSRRASSANMAAPFASTTTPMAPATAPSPPFSSPPSRASTPAATRPHDSGCLTLAKRSWGFASPPLQHLPDHLRRAFAILPAHVEVGHQPHCPRPDPARPHSALFQRRTERRSIATAPQIEDHDIRLHGRQIDLRLVPRRRLRKQPRVRVVLAQPCRHLFQRNQSRRCQHARLPHPATQRLAKQPRPRHRRRVAHQHRPHRRAQSLRQREHHRIEPAGQFLYSNSQRGRRIENSRSVQMHRQSQRVRSSADLPRRRHRHHRPSRRHVRVFDTNQSGRRMKRDLLKNRAMHQFPGQDAALRRHRPQRAPGECRGHSHLPVQHVRARLAHHLLPVLRMQPDRHLVPHRPGRQQQRRLAPEHLRRPRLQAVHRRVFAVHVVAYFGLGHRLPHLRRRPRHRIASQINQHIHLPLQHLSF